MDWQNVSNLGVLTPQATYLTPETAVESLAFVSKMIVALPNDATPAQAALYKLYDQKRVAIVNAYAALVKSGHATPSDAAAVKHKLQVLGSSYMRQAGFEKRETTGALIAAPSDQPAQYTLTTPTLTPLKVIGLGISIASCGFVAPAPSRHGEKLKAAAHAAKDSAMAARDVTGQYVEKLRRDADAAKERTLGFLLSARDTAEKTYDNAMKWLNKPFSLSISA